VRGVAHPYPNPAITLYGGISRHSGIGRNLFLTGNLNAFPRKIVCKTVIAALNGFTDQPPFGERDVPVAAPVFYGYGLAARFTEKNDRIAQYCTRQEFVLEFIIPSGNVPAIF